MTLNSYYKYIEVLRNKILNKIIFLGLTGVILLSCKDENKKDNEPKEDKINSNIGDFDKSLLDFREINSSFTTEFNVKAFGMKKVNDSSYLFAFKLNDKISHELLNRYSISLKGYDNLSLKEPYQTTFNPKIYNIGDYKYMLCTRVIKNTKYFDSLELFIYERNNWKNNGQLGRIKIRDILFED